MDLIKLLLIFALIMTLLAMKRPLFLAVIAGCLFIVLLYDMWSSGIFYSLLSALTDTAFVESIAVLLFVMLLEGMMTAYGYMENMMRGVENLLRSKKLNIVSMPMLIGTMPSMGGALFSAPMVNKAAEGTDLNREDKTVINLVYRHIMEPIFPTYAAILLACQISGVELGAYLKYMLPVALLQFVCGFYYLRKVPSSFSKPKKAMDAAAFKRFLGSVWPLALALALIIVLGIAAWAAIGITAVFLILWLRPPLGKLGQIIKGSCDLKILGLVTVIFIFKGLLEDSGAILTIPHYLAMTQIPETVIFALLFFLLCALTGMQISAAAIGLPLAMGAIPDAGPLFLVLLSTASQAGNAITPMHLCISVTAEYFKADLRKTLLRLAPFYLSFMVLAVFACLLFSV